MNLEARLDSITEFLRPWLNLLEVEILKRYPEPLPLEVQTWARELQDSSMEELLDFINHRKSVIRNEGLQGFLSKISELTSFETLSKGSYKLPQHLNRRVDLKKKTEVKEPEMFKKSKNGPKTRQTTRSYQL